MHEMEFGEFDSSSRLKVVDVKGASRAGSDALFICAETVRQSTQPLHAIAQFYLFLPMIGEDYIVDSTDLVVEGRSIPLYRHNRIFGACADGDSDVIPIPVVRIADTALSEKQLAQELSSGRAPPVLYLLDGAGGGLRLIYMHEEPVVAGSQLVEFEALNERKRGSAAWALAIPGAFVVDVVTLPLQIPVFILFALTFGDSEEDLR